MTKGLGAHYCGPPIIMYTTSWCGDCRRSRRLLDDRAIPYANVDIEEVDGAEDAMRTKNGGSGKVPTILVGDRVLVEPTDPELEECLRAFSS